MGGDPTARPTHATGRSAAVDLARGLAVVAMVVAHTAPVGGIFNVSDYVTAPLFALLVGTGQALDRRARPGGPGTFWLRQALRAAALASLGVALQRAYAGILVVLVPLAIVMALLPPLVEAARRSRAAVAALALGLLALSPPLTTAATGWVAAYAGTPLAVALGWTLAHPTYRTPSLLAAALLGVVLAPTVVPRAGDPAPRPRRLLAAAAGLAALAGLAVLVGKRTGLGADPYSGTPCEVLASTALAVAALLGSAWLWATARTRGRAALAPLVDTGRLALSCYALQVVVLAVLVATVTHDGDDHWWVLVAVTVVLVGFASAWRRLAGPVGPVEWVVRLPTRPLRGVI